LVLALLLNQKVKLKGVFRTLFFLPIIVVSGPVINMLLNEGASTIPLIEQYGFYDMINKTLPYFLVEPVTTLFSQLILILWYSGVPILIFFAGLQKIDIALYEASSIDGASSWVSFWKIVLPSIKGMILINAIYIIVFLATSEINELIIWIRDSMLDASNRGFGVASAAAWVYSVSIALLLLVSFLLFGRDAKVKVKHAQITRKRGY
jgi:ABC-type sugar transport system permease subunit